ncbi:chemotaxis protein CheX [Malonomonas rubra DSM 5091]|uniref:Chemotaxis protein CheX n=1 Tax=Malonomonas rubra DSM 5091 TaxID=1122189 RepID=A0A1M6G9P7_MALRU|nr:chemotaxis protein CheX [Malonomonas rubra]SHJ06673.1 chemotaxis protein CheX [Malonomonas rubra DSM 5091]
MDFAKKIIHTTEEIFNTMIFMEISSGQVLTEGQEVLDCHVSSMIGLSGDFNSMLSIHCPGNIGRAITSEMLGMDVEEIDEDVKDTLGEIANMVAGGLKESFAAEDINLELSIPTTVSGKSYTVSSPTKSNRVIIPFKLEQGRFFVEIKYSLR